MRLHTNHDVRNERQQCARNLIKNKPRANIDGCEMHSDLFSCLTRITIKKTKTNMENNGNEFNGNEMNVVDERKISSQST